ncbi:glycosyltransferase family 2 protein [Herbiconiux daphne]|uniref:Galactosyltransferase-related protein n=1 Tax=Herbiconiux daphne TaxID=2970914 RepID=A0ABT2H5L9_9MICO|nr:galactosyltransferase-related protein [Herbiconiux daphne]MCS5735216.1 galactosyltransferase-related protein [Herbiconiux daphne]
MNDIALITIAHGRHDHLRRQREAVLASLVAPRLQIVVAMGDPQIGRMPQLAPPVRAISIDAEPPLPLARARNLGAEAALQAGADVLVFVDVDCLPAPDAVGAYARAAASPVTGDRLLCGPVTYLGPPPAGGYRLDRLAELDDPHPARPAPAPGEVELGGAHELFWSLSFALRASTWRLIGGFDERYSGYGGEDTDFAFAAREAGVELAWVGDARAYHQHHAVRHPPVDHVDDIVRNANLFHERWAEWPMRGWLDAFEADGLVSLGDDGYVVTT